MNNLILSLPTELRFNIYERLLLHDGPIDDLLDFDFIIRSPRPIGLDTALMATCSQIRDECRSVLYGQNVVRMKYRQFTWLYGRYFNERCDYHHPDLPPLLRKRLEETKSFEIVYDIINPSENFEALETLRDQAVLAGKFMSKLDNIRFVCLDLATVIAPVLRVNILHGWSIVRSIGRVEVKTPSAPAAPGLPGADTAQMYVDDFKRLAVTKSPLPKMYFAAEDYTSPITVCDCLLDEMRSCAKWGDMERFIILRERYIARNDEVIAKAKERLKDHDP